MNGLGSGFGTEDRLIGYLKRQEFEVDQSEKLDHEFKIDFVIRHFPRNPKSYALGVQVTTRVGDLQKMVEFANVHAGDFRVVDKIVYLEIDSSCNFEHGVGHLIATSLSEFQFSTSHSADKMVGIKVNRDMTYSFFDIANMRAQLANEEMNARRTIETPTIQIQKEVVVAEPPPIAEEQALHSPKIMSHVKPDLAKQVAGKATIDESLTHGFINAYYKLKDYGFITGENGDAYFFGLASVSDGILRDRLIAMPDLEWAASVEGTILFRDAGRTRSNARYPEAKSIRLAG